MMKQQPPKKQSVAQNCGETGSQLSEARTCLSKHIAGKAAEICTRIIEGDKCSDAERMEAYNIRGKALMALGKLSAAAFDFYKVLEADHNHQEAFGYILQIEADTGLPLTQK